MPATAALDWISHAFVTARRSAAALDGFPGSQPDDLATAYAIQDRSRASWPDRVIGWKVGLVPPAFRERLGTDRLAGPIFRRSLWYSNPAEPTLFPVFVGGFAAVEAEFIVQLAEDLPPGSGPIGPAEAERLAGDLFIGVETAGSPLATINALGPTVVVSDFGNNAGLILGPRIPDWRTRSPESLTVRTIVDGVTVGAGSAASVPGGPLAAFRFLLDHARARAIPLKAGDLVTTGATTGIHEVVPGNQARVIFDAVGEIACTAVAATPDTLTRPAEGA
ncbi:MAG: hypothetical protein RLY86_1110 [Pseudomonadota bacterium]|jgi:2-keto-4-pentenoate hydratase